MKYTSFIDEYCTIFAQDPGLQITLYVSTKQVSKMLWIDHLQSKGIGVFSVAHSIVGHRELSG